MNRTKAPSLALALLLQIVPVCRVATTHPALASPVMAVVTRCAAAIAALLGGIDAVSGASVPVYVAGVQSLLPSQPGVRTNITGRVGSPMVLRIVLGGSVGQQPQLDYYNASPLPPGLIINTNVNTNSLGLASTNYYIYGTPTAAGVWYPVTVSAGNLLYPTVASTNILITITNASGASPPAFTSHPQPQTVTNGGIARLTAAASGTPTYQWQRNGVNVPGATSSNLTLNPVSTNDAGAYRLIASNGGGSATSQVANVTVLVPPTIVAQPQSLTLILGGSGAFDVSAAGLPPPTFQWKRNGAPLAGETNASIAIVQAQLADAGDYTVDVTNPAGTVTSDTAHLAVQIPDGPIALSELTWANGIASFTVEGPVGLPIVIWASDDLALWSAVHTNAAPPARWTYSEPAPAAGTAATRYYRASRSAPLTR